jgi:hypothetical protein
LVRRISSACVRETKESDLRAREHLEIGGTTDVGHTTIWRPGQRADQSYEHLPELGIRSGTELAIPLHGNDHHHGDRRGGGRS